MVLVVGAITGLVVLVLASVYTKRAIDRRLALRHIHASSDSEAQHMAEALLDEPPAAGAQPHVIDLSQQLNVGRVSPVGVGRVHELMHGCSVMQRPTSQTRLDRQPQL
jgi:hypothetical protein